MAAAAIDTLHPVFRLAVNAILSDLRAKGWRPVVASGVRSEAEQREKVKQGYSKTMRSWHVRTTAQVLWESRNSYSIVRGAAADIVDDRYYWGGAASNKAFQFWKDLGAAAEAHGCEWGGNWKSFTDVAHVQMRFIEDAPRNTAYV